MNKTPSSDLKKIGNEDSYTKEFLEELYEKINLKDPTAKANLRQHIILATQKYISYYNEYQRQLAAHEIKKELQKAIKNIDKVAESIIKVNSSGNYGEEMADNLYNVISEKYPSLHPMLEGIKIEHEFSTVYRPLKSVEILAAISEGIDRTLENYIPPKTTPKSVALYHWIMILSAELEPIIGHKLEQSHYYKEGNKGEYISKKKISDSELLLFIIEPLAPNVTISQIETEIKKTRKERHDAPWNDYFPKW